MEAKRTELERCSDEKISVECVTKRNDTILQYCIVIGLGMIIIFTVWILSRCTEHFWLRVLVTIGLILVILTLVYILRSTINIFNTSILPCNK